MPVGGVPPVKHRGLEGFELTCYNPVAFVTQTPVLMAMNRVPRSPLAAAAEQFAEVLNTVQGIAASGLTADQFTDLLDAATTVRSAEEAKEDAENFYRASVETALSAHEALEDLYRAMRSQANEHTNMTDELREQAGIGTPDPGGPGELPLILDLSAYRHVTGKIVLDWTGPTGTSLRYEVFARDGGDGNPWVLVGSASSTDFTHEGAPLTGHRDYHVVPLRGDRRGDTSNVAGVDA